MDRAEFDQFAEEYDAQHRANIELTGESPEYFARYKIAELRCLVKDANVVSDRVLDFGSGIGNSIPHFRDYFPNVTLVCADVSERSIELARKRFPGKEEALLISEKEIPGQADRFDVAFSACVFHHIPHDQHVGWLKELRRVVRTGGLVSIFEHNPLNPLTLRAVNTCPFDANAHLIRAGKMKQRLQMAGWTDIKIKYHVFFPRSLAIFRKLDPWLVSVPFGAQYSVTGRKR